jgi:hypothetical protein
MKLLKIRKKIQIMHTAARGIWTAVFRGDNEALDKFIFIKI